MIPPLRTYELTVSGTVTVSVREPLDVTTFDEDQLRSLIYEALIGFQPSKITALAVRELPPEKARP